MSKGTQNQYWFSVFVVSLIGIVLVLQKIAQEDTLNKLLKPPPLESYSLTEARTPMPMPEPPPVSEIYEDEALNITLNITSEELTQNPTKLKVFLKNLIERINIQERLINAATNANLSRIFNLQKTIDNSSAVLAKTVKLLKFNGYKEFLSTQKAYLEYKFQYKAGDDLGIINYSNGVRRYHITLLFYDIQR